MWQPGPGKQLTEVVVGWLYDYDFSDGVWRVGCPHHIYKQERIWTTIPDPGYNVLD